MQPIAAVDRIQKSLINPLKSNKVSFADPWHHRDSELTNWCSLSDLLGSYDVNKQISGIEDLISQGADMQTVLRLLCLASIITGGIKTKTLENIKREMLQVCFGSHLT